MTSSGEEYVIARRKKVERRQKIVAWISMMSFFGTGAFTAVSQVRQALENPEPATASVAPSLEQQAQGFELVLKREPNNLVALEGLVNLRLEMKDTQGAIPPLEKLVKLYPERENYKALLERLKKEVGKGESQTENPQKPN
jgi:cytochrome c-type biogenesis protein CcmH/NrfG